MRKSTPILLSTGQLRLSVIVLLVVSLACDLTIAPTQDISLMGTAIMQTMVSGVTQTAQAVIPVDLVDSPTVTQTFTPIFTPTETLTPSPVFTATSSIPQISVSVATNCRVGPGKVYDRVGALLVGDVTEVLGRDPVGNYWYIRNPNQSNGFCWLWGEYATVTGNFAALPVFTPPPTPTPVPAFEASYDRLETCSTSWWVDIKLTNTGGISFESLSLTVRDMDTDIVVSIYSDVFKDINGCIDSSTKDVLNPGANRIVSAPAFAYDPSGHKLRATITLCSRDGQNGTCVTEVVKLKP
jgi:hypothetical protein